MAQTGKGLDYLKSIPSILKIIEFVILLIAIGTVGYFLDKFPDIYFDYYGKKGNLQFFMFVVVVSWLIVMALFVLFITGLHEKLTAINWTLVVVIISAVCAVLLLISSSLVADAARSYDKKKFPALISICKAMDNGNTDAQCGQLIGGAVCGFIAMVLFAVDTAIHVRMFLTRSAAPQASTAPVSS